MKVKITDSRPVFLVGDKVKFTDVDGVVRYDIITNVSYNAIEGRLYDLSSVKLTKVR